MPYLYYTLLVFTLATVIAIGLHAIFLIPISYDTFINHSPQRKEYVIIKRNVCLPEANFSETLVSTSTAWEDLPAKRGNN